MLPPYGIVMLMQSIENDFLKAYKNKDDVQVRVLRLLKTAIKNLQVELKRLPTDDEIIVVIQKQTKQRKDSIEQFLTAKRNDLAQKEQEELEILKEYLPEPITGDSLITLVHSVIKDLGVSSKKEFGAVMGTITKQFSGRVDGKELQSVVQNILSSLE